MNVRIGVFAIIGWTSNDGKAVSRELLTITTLFDNEMINIIYHAQTASFSSQINNVYTIFNEDTTSRFAASSWKDRRPAFSNPYPRLMTRIYAFLLRYVVQASQQWRQQYKMRKIIVPRFPFFFSIFFSIDLRVKCCKVNFYKMPIRTIWMVAKRQLPSATDPRWYTIVQVNAFHTTCFCLADGSSSFRKYHCPIVPAIVMVAIPKRNWVDQK